MLFPLMFRVVTVEFIYKKNPIYINDKQIYHLQSLTFDLEFKYQFCM